MAKTQEDKLLEAIFGGEWANGVEVNPKSTPPCELGAVIKAAPTPNLEKLGLDFLAYTGEELNAATAAKYPNFSGFYRKRGWTPEDFTKAMSLVK